MPKISLTKSGLQKERAQMQLYVKLLPSLELKRMQLMAEYARAKLEMENFKQTAENAIAQIMQKIPMLANRDVQLKGVLKIDSIVMDEQNVVGVKIPHLKEIAFTVAPYSLLATPHWVDAVIKYLKEGVEAKIKLKIMEMLIETLGRAVRRMTQRVNLFEKILIPSCKKNIQKIQIALGDSERSAVIRSKLAKAHHMKQSELEEA
jgi:V/A-type H+/Na+-transporting ATPase subunit D